ncbi:hypothetical protein [uncultured Hyphomonas sp.]|uniref:hypothetical protein n=1 Tax=uncultured Hyphomonas sp. TaxID=225298 RepID=UPI002AAC4A62|nr:hypothetical protein [uncultured Hyphomonas sp.]
MRIIRAILITVVFTFVPACAASRIVTAPVGFAVDVVGVAGKGVVWVGGTAVRVTGDALDGPDEHVRLDVTYKNGKHTRKTIKKKNLERELKKLGEKGTIVDVEVSPAG